MKKIIFWIIFLFIIWHSINDFIISEAIGQEQTQTEEQDELEEGCE